MTEQEFLDKCAEIVRQFHGFDCQVVRAGSTVNAYSKTGEATFSIKVLLRPETAQCKMCAGQGGQYLAECAGAPLIWVLCRYCDGIGRVTEA